MRSLALVLATAGTIACSGGPTTPTPPATTTPPSPTTYTISGTVTATNGGQALAGATVDLSGTSTTTDPGGRYSLTLALSLPSTLALRISGAGVMTRTGLVRGGSSRTADLDAIRLDGTFDLNFYRQFAHNLLDSPNDGTALVHWTQAPKIYVQTVDVDGRPVEARTLTVTVNALASTAGLLTGGRFGLEAIEQGTGSKIGEAGWVTIRWQTARSGPYCGATQSPGSDRGALDLYYLIPSCSCPGSQIRASTVKHELGHVLGFWHTDNPADLMNVRRQAQCDQEPTAREKYHAAIAYSRPVGNYDPDNDPTDATYGRPLATHWIP